MSRFVIPIRLLSLAVSVGVRSTSMRSKVCMFLPCKTISWPELMFKQRLLDFFYANLQLFWLDS